MNIGSLLSGLAGTIDGFVKLGLSLVVLFLVIQVLFPGAGFDVVGSVSGVVEAFTGNGFTGLIAFLVFLAIIG